MLPQPQNVTLPYADFEAFDLLSFGSVSSPTGPARFGFQIDVIPSVVLSQVIFGLVRKGDSAKSASKTGFGVRVDLERGEIWDIVNGSGLIGWVEEPLGHQAGQMVEKILFSLEIERIGSALLPKLQIGGEEWLYPAVRSADDLEFVAIAGCLGAGQSDLDASDVLCNPSVWTEPPQR